MKKQSVRIMGVLNITPDSFSDGGLYMNVEDAKRRIHEMIDEGVDIIDVGAESTRPGSLALSADEELMRLEPIVEYIAGLQLGKKITFSIDTYKATVAEYALDHGFEYVNDVTALRGDWVMTAVLKKYQPFVVLMYSKDPSPRTTRRLVEYRDVVAQLKNFLCNRIALLTAQGFSKEKIIIDPGTGLFISSDPKYSFEIIDRLSEFKELGCPILIGISRKTFIGETDEYRDHASVAWSMEAIHNGASIVRIHNVKMMYEVLHWTAPMR